MNNEDRQLLEDFALWLREEMSLDLSTDTDIREAVATFMASPYYVPKAINAVSVTSLPAPHFNDGKITV